MCRSVYVWICVCGSGVEWRKKEDVGSNAVYFVSNNAAEPVTGFVVVLDARPVGRWMVLCGVHMFCPSEVGSPVLGCLVVCSPLALSCIPLY